MNLRSLLPPPRRMLTIVPPPKQSLRDEMGHEEYDRCVKVWRAYCRGQTFTWATAGLYIRLNWGES